MTHYSGVSIADFEQSNADWIKGTTVVSNNAITTFFAKSQSKPIISDKKPDKGYLYKYGRQILLQGTIPETI